MDNQGDKTGNGLVTEQTFWCEQARNQLAWFKDFHTVLDWRPPYAEWFLGGKLNASFNCLDRHIENGRGDRVAILWEGETGETSELSYTVLHEAVCRFANALKTLGIERGDRVAIYLPDTPEIVIAMLACARIGAVHSVVNCEYSSDSLMDRINDATASLVVTADAYWRAGVLVPLLQQCDEALQNTPSVNHLVVVRRTGGSELANSTRDLWFDELLANAEVGCRPEPLASEELLYLLYTSGATGQPKGIMHTTAGFLTQVAFTHESVFGSNRDDDVFWCTFAAASAPGHSYGIYGALLHGSTTLLCEGPAGIPEPARIGGIISRNRVTQLYTSPATVRLMMERSNTDSPNDEFSSLRVLASTGATLRPEVQEWLERHVCGDHFVVTDTWWQCESGAIMLAGKAQAARPLPGLSIEVVDGEVCSIFGETGQLAVTEPWPAMMRGVWDAPRRYRESYWPMSGEAFISGDIAQADSQGAIRLLGRAQDRINTEQGWVAPLEIEALLNLQNSVSESMVVGVKSAADTDVIVGFVVLADHIEPSDELAAELLLLVNENSDYPSCTEKIYIAPGLPRTSDGKYMRHLLRDMAAGQNLGDTTALLDSRLISEIKERAAYPENWCWNTGPVAPGKVVLVDIDGVIADARERMRGIETGRDRWPDFFKNVGDDELIGEVAHLLELISSDFIIVLLSARPLNSQDTTIEWLHRHKVRWDLMILRATSSMQRPAHYKRHRTRELRERGFDPVFSLEDDPRNVEMYREEGVPCLYIHSGIHTA